MDKDSTKRFLQLTRGLGAYYAAMDSFDRSERAKRGWKVRRERMKKMAENSLNK